MKILHLGYENHGDLFLLQHRIARGLAKESKCELVEAYLFGEDVSDTFVSLSLSKWWARRAPRMALKKLRKLCRDEHITHVITHRYLPASLIGRLHEEFNFEKVITVFHGLGEFKRKERSPFFDKYLLDALKVGVSNAVRDDLIEGIPSATKSNTLTVYNGLDLEDLRKSFLTKEKAREKLDLEKEKFVFGSVGRLVPKKGFDILIRAFAKAGLVNAELVIIGEGREYQNLKDLVVSLGVEARVKILGRIDYAARYMKAFDTFVLASRSEGFGLVLVEANEAGITCIAAENSGGMEEVISDKNHFFDTSCLDSFAAKLQACYDGEISHVKTSKNNFGKVEMIKTYYDLLDANCVHDPMPQAVGLEQGTSSLLST